MFSWETIINTRTIVYSNDNILFNWETIINTRTIDSVYSNDNILFNWEIIINTSILFDWWSYTKILVLKARAFTCVWSVSKFYSTIITEKWQECACEKLKLRNISIDTDREKQRQNLHEKHLMKMYVRIFDQLNL